MVRNRSWSSRIATPTPGQSRISLNSLSASTTRSSAISRTSRNHEVFFLNGNGPVRARCYFRNIVASSLAKQYIGRRSSLLNKIFECDLYVVNCRHYGIFSESGLHVLVSLLARAVPQPNPRPALKRGPRVTQSSGRYHLCKEWGNMLAIAIEE
jgi:hypothetical protein